MAAEPAVVASALEHLRRHIHQTRLLGSISSALYYDQNTEMPAAGATWRGEQLALLAGQLHQRQSSADYAELVAAAESELDPEASPERRRNLQLLRLELDRQRCLDPALVSALAKAQSRGNAVWQDARQRNDFSTFAPALQELIALRRQQASQLAAAEPVPRSPWEILAQPFEPDISKARLALLFAPLKRRLPALLQRAAAADARRAVQQPTAPDVAIPESKQEQFCTDLLDSWGFDGRRCQRSRSAHPFSCTLGPQDFRMTTRVVPGQPLSALLATAHEWGHSLYEQGLPRGDDHWFPWPLGEATSMGVHESQALFWECRIARSEAFSKRWHPRFAAALGSDPWNGSFGLWRAFNPVKPGLIRVEAGELSYCLHIVLRYELELALLEQEMPVDELPQQWNQRMQELLGLQPQTDAEGCLQDIHWAEGLFGYFSSYALGHLISAQMAQTLERDFGGAGAVDQAVASGEDGALQHWLAQHIWPLGRGVNGEQLVQQVTGKELSCQPFLAALEAKLERLETGP
ncbi:MAG: carboxypeptidase M32 [Cyanobacteria bacterium K_DeepCast_35m_m2_023]|nr:carboxypeptidase M32 [Cyanobacteria bacterium K_DeepCast_35m_m2_023]